MMDAATLAIGGYILLMCVAAAASISRPGWDLTIAGFTVLYLWIFGEIAVLFEWYLPITLYLTMDVAAFFGFWFIGKTLGARIFAVTFAVQVLLHIAYVIGLLPMAPMTYWWTHAATGYAQLLVLIGWTLAVRGQKEAEA